MITLLTVTTCYFLIGQFFTQINVEVLFRLATATIDYLLKIISMYKIQSPSTASRDLPDLFFVPLCIISPRFSSWLGGLWLTLSVHAWHAVLPSTLPQLFSQPGTLLPHPRAWFHSPLIQVSPRNQLVTGAYPDHWCTLQAY